MVAAAVWDGPGPNERLWAVGLGLSHMRHAAKTTAMNRPDEYERLSGSDILSSLETDRLATCK
jgi:hypothetical protein